MALCVHSYLCEYFRRVRHVVVEFGVLCSHESRRIIRVLLLKASNVRDIILHSCSVHLKVLSTVTFDLF